MTLHLKTLAAAAFATLVRAGPAFAHTSIKTANIENGAVLAEAPTVFEFSFGGTIGLAGLELQTLGEETSGITLDAPRGMQKDFSIDLPVLAAGEYVLKWRAVAKDGHVMKGEVAFTIAD